MNKKNTDLKSRMALRDKFFQRLGPCGETMNRLFDLVNGLNFNMIDDKDRVMAFNRSNRENCNVRDEADFVGKNLYEIFPKALADVYSARNREVRNSGRPIIEKTYSHAADRSTDIKIVSVFPLRDVKGKIIGTASINHALESGSDKPDWYRAIRAAVAHIDDHFREKLSIESLAHVSNMSASAFRRAFEKIMDTTPGAYITTIRINHARKLLTKTNKTISNIAEECGFYDQSHFTKAFIRLRRQSPGEYRRHHL
jgi:AraC-like DNA-binding protein